LLTNLESLFIGHNYAQISTRFAFYLHTVATQKINEQPRKLI